MLNPNRRNSGLTLLEAFAYLTVLACIAFYSFLVFNRAAKADALPEAPALTSSNYPHGAYPFRTGGTGAGRSLARSQDGATLQ